MSTIVEANSSFAAVHITAAIKFLDSADDTVRDPHGPSDRAARFGTTENLVGTRVIAEEDFTDDRRIQEKGFL